MVDLRGDLQEILSTDTDLKITQDKVCRAKTQWEKMLMLCFNATDVDSKKKYAIMKKFLNILWFYDQ